MTGQLWSVRITAPAADISPDDLARTAESFDATVSYNEATQLLTAAYEVEAPTLRQATDEALKEARHLPAKPTRLDIQPLEDWMAEQRSPQPLDLVGATEVAEILSVSRQRVGQLLTDKADFPAPVARLANGAIWTRASVDHFRDHWTRKITGRPRKVGFPTEAAD